MFDNLISSPTNFLLTTFRADFFHNISRSCSHLDCGNVSEHISLDAGVGANDCVIVTTSKLRSIPLGSRCQGGPCGQPQPGIYGGSK